MEVCVWRRGYNNADSIKDAAVPCMYVSYGDRDFFPRVLEIRMQTDD